MRYINYLVIITIAFILHNTLGVFIKLGRVVPDLTLIALISIAFIEEQQIGTASGFYAGILKDLISLRGFGVNAFTNTLIGYIAGILDKTIISNIFVFMLLIAGFTLLSNFFYMLVAFLISYQIDYLFWWQAIIASFYNALISPLIYLPIAYVHRNFIDSTNTSGALYSRQAQTVGQGTDLVNGKKKT